MTDAATTGRDGPWPVLDTNERRVLGVLVEKAKTTPDAYPLSVNALVTGCNQKSNRDPILDLEEDDVLDALNLCKGKGLVMKVIGGRVERWRHLLYETWHVDKVELAILAELLLRGPQTEGELRTRAGRMEAIDDLDMLRSKLRPLVERRLVVYLTPEDRRGAMLTHGFHEPAELERLRKQASAGGPVAVAAAAVPPPGPRSDERFAAVEATFDSLRDELAGTMKTLQAANQRIEALEALARGLGEALEATRKEVKALRESLGG